jgi:hypothetical protein
MNEVEAKEWFRLINHYVYCNDDRVAEKQYNYVTIYGFCRNMSFATNIVFFLYFFNWFSLFPDPYIGTANIPFELGFNAVLSVILMLSFLKFFRRFSEEALLAFAVLDLDNKINDDP